ncbi:MAG: phasin family protein [Rhodocyclaceae bacterium]|nr:phasin family protein [Rhodocyclaceae bacterium]
MFSKFHDVTTEYKFAVEAGLTLANTIFAGGERLAALNLNAARELLEQSTANWKALLGVADVQSFVALQAAQSKPVIDNAISYTQRVYEIAADTKEEIAKIVAVQVADASAKVTNLMDNALKSAPAGSETAVATIRQVMGVANSAYDNASAMAKKFSDMAEANVAAAGQATLKAADNVTRMVKKAA